MTHDPMCPVIPADQHFPDMGCQCWLIAKVRAEYDNPSCAWGQAVCIPNCPTCRRLDALLAERSAGYAEMQQDTQQCDICGTIYADASKHSQWHASQPGERFDVSRHLTTCPYGRWLEDTPVGDFLGPCDCGVTP